MSQQLPKAMAKTVCVDFTYRVYSEGRRERLARIQLIGADGRPQPGPRRPTGPIGDLRTHMRRRSRGERRGRA